MQATAAKANHLMLKFWVVHVHIFLFAFYNWNILELNRCINEEVSFYYLKVNDSTKDIFIYLP